MVPTANRLPAAAPSRLPLATRIADYSVVALSLILGGGSIVLFAWPGRPILVDLGLSTRDALWWNVLLSFVFFAQHSIMVRRPVRRRLAAVIPARYDRAFYSITSGVALALVVLLMQPAGRPLFVLDGLAWLAVTAAAVLAVIGFALAVRALGNFDAFGLRPIRQHLRGELTHSADASVVAPPGASAFVVRGPYRWVRHPLYSCVIVLLWADPRMSPGRLVFAALWTAWIYVGTLLEERDLAAEFGDIYSQYQRQVPMLVPWRGRVPVRIEEVAGGAAPQA